MFLSESGCRSGIRTTTRTFQRREGWGRGRSPLLSSPKNARRIERAQATTEPALHVNDAREACRSVWLHCQVGLTGRCPPGYNESPRVQEDDMGGVPGLGSPDSAVLVEAISAAGGLPTPRCGVSECSFVGFLARGCSGRPSELTPTSGNRSLVICCISIR